MYVAPPQNRIARGSATCNTYCMLHVAGRLGRWLTPFNYRDAMGRQQPVFGSQVTHFHGFHRHPTSRPPTGSSQGKNKCLPSRKTRISYRIFTPIIYNYNCHSLAAQFSWKPMKIAQPHLCNVDLEWIGLDQSISRLYGHAPISKSIWISISISRASRRVECCAI